MARTLLAPPLRDGRATTTYVKKSKGAGNNPPPPPIPFRGGEGRGVLPRAGTAEMKAEDVLSLANKLSPEQRKQLLASLALQEQTADPVKQRDVDMWAGAVYSGLVATNGGSPGGVPGPAVVKRILAAPSAWKPVDGFMEACKFDQLSVTERQSVYNLLADLVIKHAAQIAHRSKIPLSPKLIGTCSSNVASLFDLAFPGYMRAGLAHIVARRLISANV